MSDTVYPNSENLTKEGIRNHYKMLRKRLQRDELSLEAERHILQDPAWREAKTIALYMALPDEMDTELLWHMARLERRQVWLPRCLEMDGKSCMEFALSPSPQMLVSGAFGLKEPDSSLCPAISGELAPDLMIVPGIAFDSKGYRLGWGNGFYDRFLALRSGAWSETKLLGLTASALCVEQLPRDPWDVPVHGIATEKGVMWL